MFRFNPNIQRLTLYTKDNLEYTKMVLGLHGENVMEDNLVLTPTQGKTGE